MRFARRRRFIKVPLRIMPLRQAKYLRFSPARFARRLGINRFNREGVGQIALLCSKVHYVLAHYVLVLAHYALALGHYALARLSPRKYVL